MDAEYWKSMLEKNSKILEQRRRMWHEEYRKLLKARKIDAALAFGPLGRVVRPNKYDPEEAEEWVNEMLKKDANAELARINIERSKRWLGKG